MPAVGFDILWARSAAIKEPVVIRAGWEAAQGMLKL